jgi:hypothetical protein
MELRKAEKIKLREESCARRLQASYRSRLARKRALALRAEKVRLMEESCARRLQCKYRARLARRKMQALREEKQRLMEEGCAIKLQVKDRLGDLLLMLIARDPGDRRRLEERSRQ